MTITAILRRLERPTAGLLAGLLLASFTTHSALARSFGLSSSLRTAPIVAPAPTMQSAPLLRPPRSIDPQLPPDAVPIPIEPNDYRIEQTGGLAGMNVIDAPSAWSFHTGSYDTVVAVIDTGVDYTHEDLYLNIWINEAEIPGYPDAGVYGRLLDIDGDGLITFFDLNDPANQGPYTIQDNNGNAVIDGGDLLFTTYCVEPPLPPGKDLDNDGIPENEEPGNPVEPDCSGAGGWADGLDSDGNGFVDDLIGWDFKDGDNDPFDLRGHGTEMAGVIGAIGDNATGVVGINWRTRIMAVRTPFVDELVDETEPLETGVRMLDELWKRTVIEAAAGGLRYAADNGAALSNLSRADFLHPKFKQWAQDTAIISSAAAIVGAPFTTLLGLSAAAAAIAIQEKIDHYFDPMRDAVEHARDAMHLVVAAAGNGNYDPDDPLNTLDGPGDDIDEVPFYPAAFGFDNIVSVTATQIADDHRTYMANYGRQRVDLGAPESANPTTTPLHIDNSGYRRVEGTSIAAPYVTGVAALVWDLHPDWDYRQVIAQLLAGVDRVAALERETVTGGRLNALGAVAPGSWVTHALVLGGLAQHGGLSSAYGARVSFNQAIRPETFTTADVRLLDTTTGADVALPVTEVVAASAHRFEIRFPNITGTEHNGDDGYYRLEIGPQISNYDGRRMDLDRNAISGETVADRLSLTFRVRFQLEGIDDPLTDKPLPLEP